MTEKPTFQIALVLSGTVSAGAYTAGVLDFLTEALDAWYQAFRGDPPHNIEIKAVAGNSGGAKTALLLPGVWYGLFEPYRGQQEPPAARNRLYHSWVKAIDIQRLLGEHDLKQRPNHVASLLDSTPVIQIAQEAFNVEALGEIRRRYIADPLDMYLCITDLEGVPYRISMVGDYHVMTRHANVQPFAVSLKMPSSSEDAEKIHVNPRQVSLGDAAAANALKEAALASGAFPGLLKSHTVTQPLHRYIHPVGRLQLRAGASCSDPSHGSSKPVLPDSDWLEQMSQAREIHFAAVDGGLINNHPLEYARLSLTGSPNGHNPRHADEATKAVILISPLNRHPSKVHMPAKTDLSLVDVVIRMVKAMLGQARFKPEELALAQDEDIFSRFLISPINTRTALAADGTPTEVTMTYPLYGELLGAFGAFFHESFRRHDYLLGRRNAQRFLQRHFSLPQSHPLFGAGSGWTTDLKAQYRCLSEQGVPLEKTYTHSIYGPIREEFLPIIPLVGDAAIPIPPPERPEPLRVISMPHILEGIERRLYRVLDAIFASMAQSSGLTRWGRVALFKSVSIALIAWVRRALQARMNEEFRAFVQDSVPASSNTRSEPD